MAGKRNAGAKKPPAKRTPPKQAPAKKAMPAMAADGGAAILGPSPCDRGDEKTKLVTVQTGQKVEAFFMICAGSVVIEITRTRLGDEPDPGNVQKRVSIPPGDNPLVCKLTPLAQGDYSIAWGYAFVGAAKLVFELIVDGETRFRKYRTIDNSAPVDTVFADLVVA